jgi:cyanophycinase
MPNGTRSDRRKELDRSLGPIVLMGGAIVPQGSAMREFVKLSHARQGGRVLGITSASGDPVGSARQWVRDLRTAGCENVEIPIIRNRDDASSERIASMFAAADGIFLGGGDQVKLVSILAGTAVENAIRDARLRGVVIGGTSAGAAALAKTTLAGNEVDEFGNLVKQYIGPGLGLIRHQTIIDTHFSQRRRLYRLFIAIAQFPELLGLGIDEDTALIVEGESAYVVGSGGVTFVDGGNIKYSNATRLKDGASLTLSAMRVGIIGNGHNFNFRDRELEIPPKQESFRQKVQRQG